MYSGTRKIPFSRSGHDNGREKQPDGFSAGSKNGPVTMCDGPGNIAGYYRWS